MVTPYGDKLYRALKIKLKNINVILEGNRVFNHLEYNNDKIGSRTPKMVVWGAQGTLSPMK